MVDEFKVEGVPKYPQIDNPHDPYYTCAPTSNGMATAYCLSLVGKTRVDIGCGPDNQIEDYINALTQDDDTILWIKNNDARFGGWMWNYIKTWVNSAGSKGNPPRQILAVEAYVFTRVMEEHGFKAEYMAFPTYDAYCAKILETKLPMLLAGDFSSVSRVGGHVNCGIGFNRKGLQEIITNDPFGNGLRGFPPPNDCIEMRYPARLFLRPKPTRIDAVVITRV